MTLLMDYGLWLDKDDAGRITLTGWTASEASNTTDHWPVYTLCHDRAQLPDRLDQLGLDLAPGADINDLDKAWDVYVQHPNIAALRAQLDRERDQERTR